MKVEPRNEPRPRLGRRVLWVALAAAALLPQSCFSEGNGLTSGPLLSGTRDASIRPPPLLPEAGPVEAGVVDSQVDAPVEAAPPVFDCPPIESNEPLRARSAVMSDTPVPTATFVTQDILFDRFKKHCGSCHVDQALGGFESLKVSSVNFGELVDEKAVEAMRQNDPDKSMPPGGPIWDERPPSDPIRHFANLLEKWIIAGRPGVLWIEPETTSGLKYVFSKQLGEGLTNVGNCLPDRRILSTARDRVAERDAFFAAATDLPLALSETDLTTFDSAQLGAYGVIAYAPAYPLWSDDAGKIRHVRVPRGQSIRFKEATQSFDIPENTRFYKTFLKEVVDETGEKRFRKIETRLIVSRQDNCSSGTCRITSLMGTYAWNPEETQATLVQDPLRNGEPFGDRLLTYATDEVRANEIRNNPELDAATQAAELAKVSRHYAIPGKFRCEQCHMGSPSGDAVLGFTPLQIHRRPYVAEENLLVPAEELQGFGVLEEDAPGKDELNQLQRFIDYGLIRDLESPDQIKSLKESQASPPRNGYELLAQGYMLGNCSHCHNPRGFPSQKNPVLAPALDFLPRADRGGIFQFPLDRVSPRIRRGERLDVGIPYISPMLYDMACDDYQAECRRVRKVIGIVDELGATAEQYIHAPWRSFIFRNVSTPFTYIDDRAFFPHMPMNTPGFDCRAKRILGDWIVSIPIHHIPLPVPIPTLANGMNATDNVTDSAPGETLRPIPFIENAFYKDVTKRRLELWHASQMYLTCPDTADIVAPEVLSAEEVTPRPEPMSVPQAVVPWGNPIPGRAHWVDADPTEARGPWRPRRGDWAGVLLKEDAAKIAALEVDDPGELAAINLIQRVNLRVTPEFRAWALTRRPFKQRLPSEGCDGERTVRSLIQSGEPIPRWLRSTVRQETDSWNSRLYEISPGGQVFTNICKNCHGPVGDGQSSLGTTMAELTGGETRVANLRDGILGPQVSPGTAREGEFAEKARELGVGTDDLAARYVTWMALGGTDRRIPDAVLEFVTNTPIAGLDRPANSGGSTRFSANMLDTARHLCFHVLLSRQEKQVYTLAGGPSYSQSPLMTSIGDAELWESLCTWGQKAPIRMLDYVILPGGGGTVDIKIRQQAGNWLYDAEAYGSRPVMTPSGVKSGMAEGEPLGWCLLEPTDPVVRAAAEQARQQSLVNGQPVPYCPDPALENPPKTWDEVRWTPEREQEFALRGAMNAGMSVFVYLDAIARKEITHSPEHNECSQTAGP